MRLMKIFWLVLICLLSCNSAKAAIPFELYAPLAPLHPLDTANLPKQDKALIRDLKLINYPPLPWKIESDLDASPCYDVAIIGSGMAGITAGAALFKEGIFNLMLFDQNPSGSEGPWLNYARMRTLRSTKDLMGPALEIPHLTFHAWFEAQWGQEEWKKLGKIPNSLWMEYLNWYRHALQLPVENHCTLMSIIPARDYFELEFRQSNRPLFVKARKVVLATGRSGFGAPLIPEFVKHLPRSVYAHTTESIDFESLKNRRIGIIGAGASAFDAAAVALEKGAKSVDILMRRSRLPSINKSASLYYKSFVHGYYQLSDEQRWNFMCEIFDSGQPPPHESLDRILGYPNLRLLSKMTISQIRLNGDRLLVQTNNGDYAYDFLILGTGFQVDGRQRPELQSVIDHIALWQDRMPAETVKTHPNFSLFPYLGAHFEFLAKEAGTATYLKNLYCFNYGAVMSHSFVSSDIPAISIGAKRLAEGISADFFIQQSDCYLDRLKNFQLKEFDQDKYFPDLQ